MELLILGIKLIAAFAALYVFVLFLYVSGRVLKCFAIAIWRNVTRVRNFDDTVKWTWYRFAVVVVADALAMSVGDVIISDGYEWSVEGRDTGIGTDFFKEDQS